MQKFITYCSLVLFLGLPKQTSRACSDPGVWHGHYTFFNQEVNIADEHIPFLWTPYSRLYKDYPGTGSLSKAASDNLDYWMDYFSEGPVHKEDVSKYLYRSPVEELQEVLPALTHKRNWDLLDEDVRKNSLVRYWKNQQDTLSLTYFLFAKQTQNYTHLRSINYRPRDTLGMQMALKTAVTRFRNVKEPFIKQRYGYQVVRLYHYLDQNEQGITFFKNHRDDLNHHQQFYYWILEQVAGMYRATGQHARASYLYALVFTHCPGRMTRSLESYRITSAREWEDVMELCENRQEKAAVFTMRAMQVHSYSVEEMENIYEFDPGSKFLDLLLVRETKKMEQRILHKIRADEKNAKLPREYGRSPFAEFRRFCECVIAEKKRPDIGNWQFSLAYLKFLHRDFEAAQVDFRDLKRTLTDSILRMDVDLYRFLTDVSLLENMKTEMEDEYYERYQHLYQTLQILEEDHRSDALKDFFFDRMGHLYLNQGELAKSFLCHQGLGSLRNNPELSIIKSIKEFVSREPVSALEAYLQKRAPTGPRDDQLLEMEATAYFRLALNDPDLHKVHLHKALVLFESLSDTFEDAGMSYKYFSGNLDQPYTGRMFTAFVRDIFNYPRPDDGYPLWKKYPQLDHQYSKRDIIETFYTMDSVISSGNGSKAEYSFVLGNLFYNLTYHGVYRHVLHYANSPKYSGNLIGGGYGAVVASISDRYNFNSYGPGKFVRSTALAQQYYKKAYYNTSDRELKAWCSFMLAKCDQAELINEGKIKPHLYRDTVLHIDRQHRPHLIRFQEEFQESEVYEKAFERCSYLRWYAKNN